MAKNHTKKGQGSGSQAAVLIGIIGLLIVFYILFLPPEDRAELLGESTGGSSSSGYNSGSSSGSSTNININTSEPIFNANPGRLEYSALDEYEYELPAFTIYKSTDPVVFDSISNFYIRNGWFDKKTKNFSFQVNDFDNTNNMLLSMSFGSKKGRLIVTLNGEEVYNFEPQHFNIEPIELSKSYLKEGKNNLEFSVSDVGMEFWKTNEYNVENVEITGEITDVSRQESRNYFYITEDQGENIESASLKFNPDCKVAESGYLEVMLNNVPVFQGIPDCGIINSYPLSPSVLMVGKNTLKFKTEKGSYLIDQISVNTKLDEPTYPTYYFELDEDLFYTKEILTDRCGDIDGVCPEDCDEDLDKDCCFEEYAEAYWCDVPTDKEGDRCVGYVSSTDCVRCPSGYEDDSGYPPDDCEDLCGDDKDNDCPSGCPAFYDEDCCFDLSGDQYWCDDLPITGISFACVNEVSQHNCRNCPTGYDGEGMNPSCSDVDDDSDKEDKLKKEYSIILKFEFTERGSDKEAVIWINNHETGFDTRESLWMKNIDSFVEPDTNSIKIMPKSELEIKEISVYYEE